jgi:hypothetical protein
MTRRTARLLPIAALALVLPLAAPAPLAAQENTEEMLREAVDLYQDLQVERALALLRQVVSPSSPFEVSRPQRVQAYTYLGASLAILGRRDSALVYFRAALERDPFVDLDPTVFTATEREAFAEARRAVFAIGLRPLRAERIDPAREAFTFTVVTTHAAALDVSTRPVDGTGPIALPVPEGEGVRELRWRGLRADGHLAAPGRYALVVAGTSPLSGRADSVVAWFDLSHDRPPLEDTLPALRPDELLPERHPRAAPVRLLARGLGIAGGALLLGRVVGNPTLGEGHRTFAYGVAGAAAIAGIAASLRLQRNPELPDNIAENRRRTEARARANAEIAARNAERIAATKLVIVPAAGVGQ